MQELITVTADLIRELRWKGKVDEADSLLQEYYRQGKTEKKQILKENRRINDKIRRIRERRALK